MCFGEDGRTAVLGCSTCFWQIKRKTLEVNWKDDARVGRGACNGLSGMRAEHTVQSLRGSRWRALQQRCQRRGRLLWAWGWVRYALSSNSRWGLEATGMTTPRVGRGGVGGLWSWPLGAPTPAAFQRHGAESYMCA